MPQASIFVGNRSLGTFPVPLFHTDRTGAFPVQSVAYFCPSCGDIWGRIVIPGSTATQCRYRPCERHGDGRLTQSAWPSEPATYVTPAWPRAALERELDLELSYQAKLWST